MQCAYFDAGQCGSCALMGTPYAEQLHRLNARIRRALAEHVDASAWLATTFGPESRFRNKAKMVVGGSRDAPTFGILDETRRGIDLRACGLYEPGLHEAVLVLAEEVAAIGLTPYDVPRRSGELKHLVVTHSPTGDLMARFVLRSPGQLGKVRRGLSLLQSALPALRVVSVNLQPEHKAVLAGDDELILTDQQTLPMPIDDVTLHLRPESFFQTNTTVARLLYAEAREWVSTTGAETVWDLYCGVGGFGLSIAAGSPVRVLGVESESGAVAGANRSALEVMERNPSAFLEFRTGDTTRLLRDEPVPDLVIVNPPRRGIGPLAEQLDATGPAHVIYSSCNVTSLARDLTQMPHYRVVVARTFDMFPQTTHHEVLVRLERR